MSLRELKKARTRQAISTVATELFNRNGFDQVTLAEVAAAAEVSVNTIVNYFGSKEDLFFDAHEAAVAAPGAVLRGREPGESVVAALRRNGFRDDPLFFVDRRSAGWLHTVQGSAALRARYREILEARDAAVLEVLLAADPESARAVAGLVNGLYRALVAEQRRLVLAGAKPDAVRAGVDALARRGFALLAEGIGDYGANSSGVAAR